MFYHCYSVCIWHVNSLGFIRFDRFIRFHCVLAHFRVNIAPSNCQLLSTERLVISVVDVYLARQFIFGMSSMSTRSRVL